MMDWDRQQVDRDVCRRGACGDVFLYACICAGAKSRILAKTQGGAVMKAFWKKRSLLTCAFCVLSFLVIPALIYMASYTQYFMIRGGKYACRLVGSAADICSITIPNWWIRTPMLRPGMNGR
jgi:hypothetical protein